MTDQDGKLFARSSSGKTIVRVLNNGTNQATTKPLIMLQGTAVSYTGPKGNPWIVSTAVSTSGDYKATSASKLIPSDVTLTPNQAVESRGFLYANTDGKLYTTSGLLVTEDAILTPGTILPDYTDASGARPMVFTDRNGTPWLRRNVTGATRIYLDNGATIKPNLHYMLESSSSIQPTILLVDSEGTLHLASTSGKSKTFSTVKFPPNQLGLISANPSSGMVSIAYLSAEDGTVYRLGASSTSDSGFVLTVTGLYVRPSGSGEMISQMPTTGAPEGLSTVGLLAIGVGLIGVMVMLVRRRV